jgi:hypothetical protein
MKLGGPFFFRTHRRGARYCIKFEKEYNAKEWLQCLSTTTANQKISHHNRYGNNYKDMTSPTRAKGRATSATTKGPLHRDYPSQRTIRSWAPRVGKQRQDLTSLEEDAILVATREWTDALEAHALSHQKPGRHRWHKHHVLSPRRCFQQRSDAGDAAIANPALPNHGFHRR